MAMRPHVNPGSFSRNHCYETMFLMIKSLNISLFTRGDCKTIYIDPYRCPKDLYQHFKVYFVPMCFKEIPGVRYSQNKPNKKQTKTNPPNAPKQCIFQNENFNSGQNLRRFFVWSLYEMSKIKILIWELFTLHLSRNVTIRETSIKFFKLSKLSRVW